MLGSLRCCRVGVVRPAVCAMVSAVCCFNRALVGALNAYIDVQCNANGPKSVSGDMSMTTITTTTIIIMAWMTVSCFSTRSFFLCRNRRSCYWLKRCWCFHGFCPFGVSVFCMSNLPHGRRRPIAILIQMFRNHPTKWVVDPKFTRCATLERSANSD